MVGHVRCGVHRQKESSVVWAIAIGGMFVVFCLLCFNDNLSRVGDSIFLYNRCWQIRDCFRHGVYPFLYYNDVGGVGYGSPIFYGHLTLFPFMLFVDDISVFLKAYFLSCILLNFFGFRCFIKRVSDYATLTSCFYIFGMPFICLLSGNLPANCMAVGFSWFFFAYCIDYFRDGNSRFLLILTYFMIWQSNLNSAVLSTVVCFGIFCVYFDKRWWMDYLQLFLSVLLLISFNIVNILSHTDALSFMNPDDMLSLLNAAGDGKVLSMMPIGGFFVRSITEGVDMCCGFVSWGVWLVLLYFLWNGISDQSLRFRVCSVIIIVVFVVGYAIGRVDTWSEIYKATNVFFQFPIRYYIYLFGFVLAVFSRAVKPNCLIYIVIVSCVVDIFLANPFQSTPVQDNVSYVAWQMGNGEYAGDTFVKDVTVFDEYSSGVVSESGTEYPCINEYNGVSVDCSANAGDDVLTLPKLYYNWYRCYDSDGEEFAVESGVSNFCRVSIGDYRGSLRLEYKMPALVMALFVLQTLYFLRLVYCSMKTLLLYRRLFKS